MDASPQRLRSLLEKLDIPNAEATRYCGTSDTTIYRWLDGTHPIPHAVIRMFAQMLYIRELEAFLERGRKLISVTWGEPDVPSARPASDQPGGAPAQGAANGRLQS